MGSERNVWVTATLPNRQDGIMLRKHRRIFGFYTDADALTTRPEEEEDTEVSLKTVPGITDRHNPTVVGGREERLSNGNGARVTTQRRRRR